MSVDPLLWMPPGFDPQDAADLLALYPGDPHTAAAEAWEGYAATLQPDPMDGARSVSTGAQSVTYRDGGGPRGAALERARWHRSKARVRSVSVGPGYSVSEGETPGVPTPLARQVQPTRESAWKPGIPS